MVGGSFVRVIQIYFYKHWRQLLPDKFIHATQKCATFTNIAVEQLINGLRFIPYPFLAIPGHPKAILWPFFSHFRLGIKEKRADGNFDRLLDLFVSNEKCRNQARIELRKKKSKKK